MAGGMSRLIAFGLGALAMYYLDPQQGRRRRALVREQLVHYRHAALEAVSDRARDLGDRAYGLAAEARGTVRDSLERQEPSGVPESAHHLGR